MPLSRVLLSNPTYHCSGPFCEPCKHGERAQSMQRICCVAVAGHTQPKKGAVAMASASLLTLQGAPEAFPRRSGNSHPSASLDYGKILSFSNEPVMQANNKEHERLKGQIKHLLRVAASPLEKIELVDGLQQCGIRYHFEEEIQKILESIDAKNVFSNVFDIRSTALVFKVLRENGYEVSQEVLKRFLCPEDDFTDFFDHHGYDIEGILCLYEASYQGFEGEELVDMAQSFACKQLKIYLDHEKMDLKTMERVRHALQLPIHWTMMRAHARWYINFNDGTNNVNPIILQFAKLDFNLVQAQHKIEVGEITKWWTNLCVRDDLSFTWDQILESYLWTVGVIFEPKYIDIRKYITQAISLFYVIDDMYDVYGSIQDLEKFTETIERWDVNAIESLPKYMRVCFLALFNMVNESAYHILKDRNVIVTKYLKKMWLELCKSFLLEAKWYHERHIPLLEEYLRNSTISSGVYLGVSYLYIFAGEHMSKEGFNISEMPPNLINLSSRIARLNNDMATSSNELKFGDVAKAVECCMHEKNMSMSAARKHINSIIMHTWKCINRERFTTTLQKTIVDACINVCRTSHSFYKKQDGEGCPGKELVITLLFDSV